eukprot:UN30111
MTKDTNNKNITTLSYTHYHNDNCSGEPLFQRDFTPANNETCLEYFSEGFVLWCDLDRYSYYSCNLNDVNPPEIGHINVCENESGQSSKYYCDLSTSPSSGLESPVLMHYQYNNGGCHGNPHAIFYYDHANGDTCVDVNGEGKLVTCDAEGYSLEDCELQKTIPKKEGNVGECIEMANQSEMNFCIDRHSLVVHVHDAPGCSGNPTDLNVYSANTSICVDLTPDSEDDEIGYIIACNDLIFSFTECSLDRDAANNVVDDNNDSNDKEETMILMLFIIIGVLLCCGFMFIGWYLCLEREIKYWIVLWQQRRTWLP